MSFAPNDVLPTPTHSIAFAKYEGLGNDFIVIDGRFADVAFFQRVAPDLCDRRRGIGADGILLVGPATEPHHRGRMVVLNADGSRPEMCGNGLRCAALHLFRTSADPAATTFVVETDAGPRLCDLHVDDSPPPASVHRVDVTTAMGQVVGGPAHAPTFRDRSFRLREFNVGNPHAVTFDPFSSEDIDELGPQLSRAPQFPHGANIEFVSVREPTRLDVIVWERGVGRTEACGTGACAAVAAAADLGVSPFDAPVSVALPGGILQVTITHGSHRATLRGPARFVYSGIWCPPPSDSPLSEER